MLLGMLGTNELIILFVLAALIGIVFLVIRFIYRYGKQKGRLQELEKRVNDSSSNKS
jgi:positive regulator of sigma E activity